MELIRTVPEVHIVGIDNMNDYYDVSIKEYRLEEIEKCAAEHPDTHLKFEGYQIPLFPEVLEAAYKMHGVIPQIGCINWDFTINKEGEPVLIEANMKDGGVWVVEMAHGHDPFGEKTAEILRWIRMMKHTPTDQYQKYAFGKME